MTEKQPTPEWMKRNRKEREEFLKKYGYATKNPALESKLADTQYMSETIFNPAEPNTERVINLTYTTDENGEMDIKIDTVGFENGEEYVGFYIMNTLEVLSEISPQEKE